MNWRCGVGFRCIRNKLTQNRQETSRTKCLTQHFALVTIVLYATVCLFYAAMKIFLCLNIKVRYLMSAGGESKND